MPVLRTLALATFLLLAPAAGHAQSQAEDFWIARDVGKLARTAFRKRSRIGQFSSVVIHQVQPAGRDAWSDQKRQRCHFVIGNAEGLGDGVVGISPKWYKGESTGQVMRSSLVESPVGICLEGNLDVQAPTAAQRSAVVILLVNLRRRMHITAADVHTHREVDGRTTSCPGRLLGKAQLLEASGFFAAGDSTEIRVAGNRLRVLRGGHVVLDYEVSARASTKDMRPIGTFTLCRKDEGSAFYRYLGLCLEGRTEEDSGGIGIHGGGDALHFDWTVSCLALRDQDMAEVYQAVSIGATVEIRD